jgi:hypothetical protein
LSAAKQRNPDVLSLLALVDKREETDSEYGMVKDTERFDFIEYCSTG